MSVAPVSPPVVPSTPIRLVCLDVDGTLVGSAGQPTAGVWAAAARAREAGIHLAMCTARIAIGGAWSWAVHLDPDGWHLFQTGASIVHTATRSTRGSGAGRLKHTTGTPRCKNGRIAVPSSVVAESVASVVGVVVVDASSSFGCLFLLQPLTS